MKSLTLSQSCKIFFLDKTLAKTTAEQYKYFHGLLAEFLSDDPELESITSQQIRRFLKWVRQDKELSPKTAALAHTAVSSLWKWAEDELEIENIVSGIKRPKFHQKPIDIFTQEQIKAIMQAAEFSNYERYGKEIKAKRPTALRDMAIILTLLDGGLRATELCNLLISDYDDELGRFLIRNGKGDKSRFIYVGKRCQRAIMRYLINRKSSKPNDPLFAAGEFEDSHIDRKNLRKYMQRIGNSAGVKGVHPHRFRHTMAVTFLRNGGRIEQLRLLLGHGDLRTVLHYARLAEVDLENAMASASPADNWKL
ncbi:MAG: tyrosine-type recombinase/integrase [Caldilineaceae bacterium]